MALDFTLPSFLVDIHRNPILATVVPVVLGSLSGYPTATVVNGDWYKA